MSLPLKHGLTAHNLKVVADRFTTPIWLLPLHTLLMMKRVFNLLLRDLQGFDDSIFKLMALPLRCPDYSLVSKRAKSVNISIKTPTRGEILYLVVDATGLRGFG